MSGRLHFGAAGGELCERKTQDSAVTMNVLDLTRRSQWKNVVPRIRMKSPAVIMYCGLRGMETIAYKGF